jgi:4-nitrophenyl phosphatase
MRTNRSSGAASWKTATVSWVLDLDGVVWLAGQPIPGAAEAVDRLRRHGVRVVFLTNNSGPTVAEHLAALATAGITAQPDEVMTSGEAAARLFEPGSRVAMLGGPGIEEALSARGVTLVGPADKPEAVVVGRTTGLDYDQLAAVATAIRDGARFVATNTDATFPTPTGPVPGAGALVAFLGVASGVDPEIAGKPHPPAVALVRDRLGEVGQGEVREVVGDRPDTDGYFARALGARFVLVLSGVTSPGDLPVEPRPDLVAETLAAAVAANFPC